MNAYYMPETALSALHILAYLFYFKNVFIEV